MIAQWFKLIEPEELNDLVESPSGIRAINNLRFQVKRIAKNDDTLLVNRDVAQLLRQFDELLESIDNITDEKLERSKRPVLSRPFELTELETSGQTHLSDLDMFSHGGSTLKHHSIWVNGNSLSVGTFNWLPMTVLAAFLLDKSWLINQLNRFIDTQEHRDKILDWFKVNDPVVRNFLAANQNAELPIDIICNELMRGLERCYPYTRREQSSRLTLFRKSNTNQNLVFDLETTLKVTIESILKESLTLCKKSGLEVEMATFNIKVHGYQPLVIAS